MINPVVIPLSVAITITVQLCSHEELNGVKNVRNVDNNIAICTVYTERENFVLLLSYTPF